MTWRKLNVDEIIKAGDVISRHNMNEFMKGYRTYDTYPSPYLAMSYIGRKAGHETTVHVWRVISLDSNEVRLDSLTRNEDVV